MDRRGVTWARIFMVVAAVSATACSRGTAPPQQAATTAQPAAQPATQPTATPAQPSSAAAPGQSAPAGNVIASGEYSADPQLRCDLLEVKRVSGGAVLVKWRTVNTAPTAGGLTDAKPKVIYYDGHWTDLYFIDPAENKKYSFLTDAGGERIAEVAWGNFPAGEQRGNWAKFPAPPATSGKIAIHIPSFPPFEDVPVSQ